ncbi:family 16 glycosylhydrolase [Paracoccus stylophorae]|uniref:Family 16 glycosylhydrolase n=1 Tax=Paracoccus stylophorae TaxID=659350 RepID=A0ABY7SVC4_9RHOB|nr:family 16 glycosylhydrolase [Paracoccus stylophorae]WCR10818.1 family 16 glycosylhydrolase [Paracoccus stylophorae]
MALSSAYELVFRDDFDGTLNAYGDGRGLWSTSGRRDDLMTNGPQSVFLSDATRTQDGRAVGIDPLKVSNGSLNIGSGVIPDDKLDLVRDALAGVGRADQAGQVRYYTGMVSTAETWAQAYGYYEITAEIPVGKGHWPAFWLAPAGIGWPPEIDIFEIYSKGVGAPTGKDNTFSSAAFFDRTDIAGNQTQDVDWTNPHDPDADGNPRAPMVKQLSGGEQYIFQHTTDALQEFGADLHDGKWTWAAEWTPDHIAFHFGRDRESMVEIYRSPVPEDLTTPMYVIINDQIGSTWGWNPVDGLDHLTFAPGNDFKIDSVAVYALKPTHEIRADGIGAVVVDDETGSRIVGSAGDDVIVTGGGAGQDFVSLGGGRDILHVTRGTGNAIVSDFGADDLIVLEGFHFDGAQDAKTRLTQVGNDVWLANGAYPSDPQTIVFRDTRAEAFQIDQFAVRWSVTPNVWTSGTRDARRIADADGDGLIAAGDDGDRMTDTGGIGRGAITLRGGAGGDEFFVYRRDTLVTDMPVGGVDLVHALHNFTLPDHVENLTALPGARRAVFTGNAGDNRIEGNSHANTLRGGQGDDLIVTVDGDDVIVHAFGDGHDVVLGFDASDRIRLTGYAVGDAADLLSRLRQDGAHVHLDLGEGGSISFRDTELSAFGDGSFEIAAGGGRAFGQTVADPLAQPGESRAGTAEDHDPPRADPPIPDQPAPPDPDRSGMNLQGHDHGERLRGGSLDDMLRGGAGDDLLRGLDGDDWLDGRTGRNHLNGGAGQDTLVAQGCGDRLYGEEGEDLFILTACASNTEIMDFAPGDRLDISRIAQAAEDVRLTQAGNWLRLWVQPDEDGDWQDIAGIRLADPTQVWDALQFG